MLRIDSVYFKDYRVWIGRSTIIRFCIVGTEVEDIKYIETKLIFMDVMGG